MSAPIVISEHGDITILDTIEAAERYLEAPDVENSEYEIFDSLGNVLCPRIEMVPAKRLFGLFGGSSKVVRISASSTGACDKEGLRAMLVHFLRRSGSEFDTSEALPLSELIAKARQSR
jgi:hypothetical protein